MGDEEPPRCCFCGSAAAGTVEVGGALLRFEGVQTGASKTAQLGRLFAHELCAVFSPGVRVDLERLADDYEVGCLDNGNGAIDKTSVAAEWKRGSRLTCVLCGLKGASIGCFACSRRCYHYPCAARAGLVEWHWWESGHRARIVHCVEHLNPRCDVLFSGDDGVSSWHRAAVADGPHEGRYLALYVDRPFGQESLALNERDAGPHSGASIVLQLSSA